MADSCARVLERLVCCSILAATILAGCGKNDAGAPPGTTAATKPAKPAASVPAAAQLKTITTQTGIQMVLVPAGEFTMGDDQGPNDEKPARKVKVDSFLMDRYEVTQKSFQSIAGKNPSKFQNKSNPAEKENYPAEQVNWFEAAKYCNLRSLRENLKPCYDAKTMKCDFSADGYRLPTEAEWEYACRAGTTTRYSFGNGQQDLARYGWSKENSREGSHPVGEKPANPWGLFDMHGNVAEWCNDFYAKDSYQNAEPANPKGPPAGEECVLRGGSWNKSPDACRSSSRGSETPKFADACFGADTYGFRCVRKPPADVNP